MSEDPATRCKVKRSHRSNGILYYDKNNNNWINISHLRSKQFHVVGRLCTSQCEAFRCSASKTRHINQWTRSYTLSFSQRFVFAPCLLVSAPSPPRRTAASWYPPRSGQRRSATCLSDLDEEERLTHSNKQTLCGHALWSWSVSHLSVTFQEVFHDGLDEEGEHRAVRGLVVL